MNKKIIFLFLFCFACLTSVIIGGEKARDVIVQVPPATEKAMEYYKSGNILWIFQQLIPMLIFAVLLFSGASEKIRNFAKKKGRSWVFESSIYFILFAVILFVVQLPFSYFVDFVRPHDYGLSNQGLGQWFLDTFKSSLISLIVGLICVLVVYFLIRKSPKRWWLYTTFLTLPFIILALIITPLWIEPLFNHFGPMKNKVLEAKILKLANKAGIEGARVFEVDKSQETNTLNAYVTGFGNTKRIVLWDTIIKDLTPDELLFVMGHEMGHYVLHHIEKAILFQFSLNLLLFWFLSTAPYFLRKYKEQFKIKSLSDIASLPLLLLMVSVFALVTAPLENAFSRYQEHQADMFGLEITQNNQAAARAFVKLQQQNLANPTPGPLFVFWRASHPPLGQRIEFCNSYKPWKQNTPLLYQKYINTTSE